MNQALDIRPDLKKDILKIGFKNATIGHSDGAHLIEDLNLKFSRGKIIQVIGSSGIGKSTFLKTIAGILQPLKGELFINENESVSDMSFEEFMPFRLNIGYSFEYGGLLNNRSLWDNLMLPLLYHRAARYRACEARVDHIMKMFAIDRYRNDRPSAVPGGVRKASCVARAFLLDPQILVLDEPTTGLNEEGVGALIELLRQRSENSLVLMTSRSSQVLEKVADERLDLNVFVKNVSVVSAEEKKAI